MQEKLEQISNNLEHFLFKIMESAVKQRLIHFIKCINLTQKAFEELCGMSNGYVSNIRKGIGDDKLLNIVQQFPQLNREWLLFGEGEMLKTDNHSVQQTNTYGNNNYVVGNHNNISNSADDIPFVEAEEMERAPIVPATIARAPQTDVLEALSGRIGTLEMAPIGVTDVPITMWYRVQDESIAPKYEIGDLIGLWAYPKGEEDPVPGKLYGINTMSNGLILRRLFPTEDGYMARAINRDEYPDYHIRQKNIVQVYKIMLMVRF